MADVVAPVFLHAEKLKIMTWNINGIRAVTREKSLKSFLDDLDVDILCFQETKITRDMLEESICIVEGYNAYFSFSRVKTGYSGVATFCRDSATPSAAEEGLTSIWTDEPTIGCYGNTDCFSSDQLTSLDKEGRGVLTEHVLGNGEKVVIVNVYCPRADSENEERMEFKMQYYKLLQLRVEALLESGRHVIVLGDLNITHKPIDNCNPGDLKTYNAHPSRVWMDQFVKEITVENMTLDLVGDGCNGDENTGEKQISLSGTLVDSFRYIHLNQPDAYTNWNTSTGARQTNYGKRLDYILGDVLLVKQNFVDCVIRREVEGSDHCPVVAFLKSCIVPAKRPPALCTKFMPEFSGKQQKLASYFIKKTVGKPTLKDEKEKSSKSSQGLTSNQGKRGNKNGANPQAKRLKTAQPRQQNNLLQFFGKKSSETFTSSPSSCNDEKPSESLPNSGSNSNSKVTFSDSEPDSQGSLTPGTPTITPEPSENSSDDKNSAEVLTKASDQRRQAEVSLWKNILKGPPPAPLCPGHNEPCVLRTVKKKGPNCGRQFYCCARPEGYNSNKEARCKFFKWTK